MEYGAFVAVDSGQVFVEQLLRQEVSPLGALEGRADLHHPVSHLRSVFFRDFVSGQGVLHRGDLGGSLAVNWVRTAQANQIIEELLFELAFM